MYVTVQFRDDEDRQKAHVVGIHESAELAAQVVDNDSAKKTELLPWPSRHAPELGAVVAISDRQIVPDKQPGLLSLLEMTLKGQELRELRDKNEALAQYNVKLQSQLEVKQQSYRAQLRHQRTKRQVRDLWISATAQTARENLVADFVRAEAPTLSERIMIVPDAESVPHFNRLAQENRTQHESFDATCGIAYNHILLHRGDRVAFAWGDPELGITEADLGEIIALFPDHRTVAVALDRRDVKASELAYIPLNDYPHLDLGYATTYERAGKLHIYHAFVLGDQSCRELVDSLSARNVGIYADKLTAYTQFPELAGKRQMSQTIDMTADPLAIYHTRE